MELSPADFKSAASAFSPPPLSQRLIAKVSIAISLGATGVRRRPDLNRRMRVLQTLALPLGYVALRAGDGIRTHGLLLGKETFYH